MRVEKTFELAGKTALITGRSRGLRLQMAEVGRDPVSRRVEAGSARNGLRQ
jgi:hypothetical protein